MNGNKILIVDDDRVWTRLLGDFFRGFGYEIHTALSCAEGLALAGKHRPGCILLDFHLPDARAGTFCEHIRADQALKKTPLIIVSGDEREELNSYSKHQADGFVLKGGKLEKIRLMVESLLRRVRWERGIIEKGDLRLEAENLTVFRELKAVAKLSPEQFRFLFILIERAPGFVSEEDILKFIFGTEVAPEKYEALRGVANRLRGKLGKRLGGRIKGSSLCGWVYLQPAERGCARKRPGPARSGAAEAPPFNKS